MKEFGLALVFVVMVMLASLAWKVSEQKETLLIERCKTSHSLESCMDCIDQADSAPGEPCRAEIRRMVAEGQAKP